MNQQKTDVTEIIEYFDYQLKAFATTWEIIKKDVLSSSDININLSIFILYDFAFSFFYKFARLDKLDKIDQIKIIKNCIKNMR